MNNTKKMKSRKNYILESKGLNESWIEQQKRTKKNMFKNYTSYKNPAHKGTVQKSEKTND